MKKLILNLLFAFCCVNLILEAAPAQVFIIRHAEKPASGDSLSTKGRERAAALVPYFMETKELLNYGPPVAVYAMSPSKANPSERPIETVKGLAEALKVTLNSSYERDGYKKMVEDIMNDTSNHGKTVLICWEHQLIPEIARAFKAFQTPGKWQNEVFDRIWIVNLNQGGKVSFQNVPQKLMFGDSSS